jgi:RNA polymerase sigma-70 factor (ECF subfamily)
MSETPFTQAERDIRALLAAGDRDAALTLLVRTYGPELLGFLHARLLDLQHARDAFAWLAEALWKALPGFRADSSLRSFAYAIARNVAARFVQRELHGPLVVPLSQLSQDSALAVELPLSTNLDTRIERLRALLSDDERTLLTLRLDKRMDWKEIALVMLFDGAEPPGEAEQVREAARLRKRFQLLKQRLRELAVAA